MEEKILKTNVYVNDTLFNDTAELPIDVDFTLPDYCNDISKILKCQAVSKITSRGNNGKIITVDGVVTIRIFYADEMGNLCSFEYQYPFSKNFDTGEDYVGTFLKTKAKCDYINCRAVTGRKVDIHGAVSVFVKLSRRNSTQIISDIDDPNIEQRRSNAPVIMPMGCSEKYLMVEEDIPIGQGQPAIEKIFRYSVSPSVNESKIINDKIVVKGDILLTVIYCPVGSKVLQTVKTVIPYSQIVDMEGITDVCKCDTKCEVAFVDIRSKNTEEEAKCFSFSAKLLLSCEAFCENDIAIITDAYSRKYHIDLTRNVVSVDRIADNVYETFHCKKNIELIDAITTVADFWCDFKSSAARFENNDLIISGTVNVCMLTEDDGQNPSFVEKPIDFEYKYHLKTVNDMMSCTPEINIISMGYTIIGPNNIELKIDLGINATVYEKNNITLISSIVADETQTDIKKTNNALTIYFSGENECVWDIAKHYNASIEEIMRINELESEILPDGKMILVPLI